MADSYIITERGEIIRTSRKNRFTSDYLSMELLILGESIWEKKNLSPKIFNCRYRFEISEKE